MRREDEEERRRGGALSFETETRVSSSGGWAGIWEAVFVNAQPVVTPLTLNHPLFAPRAHSPTARFRYLLRMLFDLINNPSADAFGDVAKQMRDDRPAFEAEAKRQTELYATENVPDDTVLGPAVAAPVDRKGDEGKDDPRPLRPKGRK